MAHGASLFEGVFELVDQERLVKGGLGSTVFSRMALLCKFGDT